MISFSLKTNNAAFSGDWRTSEMVGILRDLANELEQGHRPSVIHDTNGGAVGHAKYTGKDK